MLRIRVNELSLQDRNRLSTELAMVLLTEMTYPPFMDYRAAAFRTRPYSQADLQRAESFIAGLGMERQEHIEISSSALAEQLADLFINYYRAVVPVRAQRATDIVQRDAMQLATQVQRRLVAYVLDGANNGFGLSVTPTSWNDLRHAKTPPWEATAPARSASRPRWQPCAMNQRLSPSKRPRYPHSHSRPFTWPPPRHQPCPKC